MKKIVFKFIAVALCIINSGCSFHFNNITFFENAEKTENVEGEKNGEEEKTLPSDIIPDENNELKEENKEKTDFVEREVSQKNITEIYIKNVENDLNVRAEPKHESELVGMIVKNGQPIEYRGEKANGLGSDGKIHVWYKIITDEDKTIQGNEITGWIRSDLVKRPNIDEVLIGSDADGATYKKFVDGPLNVREEPKHESKLLGKVTDGNTVMLSCNNELGYGLGSDGQMHEWCHVIVNSDLQGWVRSDLIEYTIYELAYDRKILVKNTMSDLNVREEPKHESKLVGKVTQNNTNINYDGKSEMGMGSDGQMHEWYYVEVSKDIKGWVRSDLVKER